MQPPVGTAAAAAAAAIAAFAFAANTLLPTASCRSCCNSTNLPLGLD